MKRIFIAGAYNADNICEVLNNIRAGMEAGQKLLVNDFLPFNPFLDFFYHLVGGNKDLPTIEQYRAYCLELVELSHAILCLSGYETHEGVIYEIQLANKLDIKIYYDIDTLIKAGSSKSSFPEMPKKATVPVDEILTRKDVRNMITVIVDPICKRISSHDQKLEQLKSMITNKEGWNKP